MRLIDPADRKCLQYSSVHPLTLERLLCIEGTFILIDHDPVLVEGVVAVSIEFFREKPLSCSERIRRVYDDQIIGVSL